MLAAVQQLGPCRTLELVSEALEQEESVMGGKGPQGTGREKHAG